MHITHVVSYSITTKHSIILIVFLDFKHKLCVVFCGREFKYQEHFSPFLEPSVLILRVFLRQSLLFDVMFSDGNQKGSRLLTASALSTPLHFVANICTKWRPVYYNRLYYHKTLHVLSKDKCPTLLLLILLLNTKPLFSQKSANWNSFRALEIPPQLKMYNKIQVMFCQRQTSKIACTYVRSLSKTSKSIHHSMFSNNSNNSDSNPVCMYLRAMSYVIFVVISNCKTCSNVCLKVRQLNYCEECQQVICTSM